MLSLIHFMLPIVTLCSQHTMRHDTTHNEQSMLPTEHDDL